MKLESRQFPPTALRRDPVRIAYSYVALGDLVRRAYDLPPYRIECPERLADTMRGLYSVEATFPEGTTDAGLRGMLQRLLENQLALRMHRMNRSLSGYELKTAASGAKIRPSKWDPAQEPRFDPNDERENNRYRVFQGQSGWRITGVISMRQLAGLLTTQLGRPMIDKTQSNRLLRH